MPFKSQAERGWMYANKPALAKKFESDTPKGAALPEHVKDTPGEMLKRKIRKSLIVASEDD